MNEPIQSGGEAMPETRDIGDACDILCRAIHLNELIFRVGEGLNDRALANALTTGADVINDLLKDLSTILHAHYTGRAKS